MAYYRRGLRRSLNTTGSLQIAARWRDGKQVGWEAWWTFQPGRVGFGGTKEDAIRSIPPRKVKVQPS